MEKTPSGTSVGVDDPHAYVERCDFVTDDGRCRFAVEHGDRDPTFANERRADDFRCPAADPDDAWEWADCPHMRSREHDRECARCGLEEKRVAHEDKRPLLEEHHLAYRNSMREGQQTHEITIYLCRWCHAKIHNSWARIDDDANPDPEAIAERESRKGDELDELSFESAADRFERE